MRREKEGDEDKESEKSVGRRGRWRKAERN